MDVTMVLFDDDGLEMRITNNGDGLRFKIGDDEISFDLSTDDALELVKFISAFGCE